MKGRDVFMKNLIITISRQYGSGGRKIGQQLSEELGIPFYDSEIIDLAAKESGLAADFIRGQEQQLTQSLLFSLVTNFTSNAGAFNPNMLSLSDQVYLAQAKAIRSLADKGPCVIVGRCADWVLEKDYEVLRVFVCGPLEARCKRAVEEYGDSAEDIQKTVKNIDKQRARYCQHYCDKAWEDAENYDLCLNGGTISLENCVAIVKSAYQELAK